MFQHVEKSRRRFMPGFAVRDFGRSGRRWQRLHTTDADRNTSGDPHGPVLMMTGTTDVIDDMRMTMMTLDEAPAILVALPIGHLDVITEIGAGGRYVAPTTAWLRYWVNGDDDAKRYFWGDNSEMCKSPWITPEPNAKWKAQML